MLIFGLPPARARLKADAFAAQEAQLVDDKRRLKQHVREREASAEELIKQFRWVVPCCVTGGKARWQAAQADVASC